MHSEFWAREVVSWVKSAEWIRVFAAIAAADERHLDLLEALLVQEDLLWRLNGHLPRAIRERREALCGRQPDTAPSLEP